MTHNHKSKNYLERPRWRKKQLFIALKNRIREAAPVLGGLFHTQDYMNGHNAWIDCCFLSKSKPLVFYNCTLETTRYRYKDLVVDAAWEAAEKLVPHVSSLDFSRAGQERFENQMHSPRAEFGGLTRAQWWTAEERRLADSLFYEVYEEVTLHFDYSCGVGLHATLNVEHLTIEAVNEFIRRFQKCEMAYRDTTALKYTYEEIGYWGLDANAIVDPKDYATLRAQTDDTPDNDDHQSV